MSQSQNPQDRLHAAALAYTQAKAAVDDWHGERRGKAFQTAVEAWRAATNELTRSARAYSRALIRIGQMIALAGQAKAEETEDA